VFLTGGRAIAALPRTTAGIQPDPRAYMRVAQMLRDLISSGGVVPGTPVLASPGCARSTGTPGRHAPRRFACWKPKASCAGSPAWAITSC